MGSLSTVVGVGSSTAQDPPSLSEGSPRSIVPIRGPAQAKQKEDHPDPPGSPKGSHPPSADHPAGTAPNADHPTGTDESLQICVGCLTKFVALRKERRTSGSPGSPRRRMLYEAGGPAQGKTQADHPRIPRIPQDPPGGSAHFCGSPHFKRWIPAVDRLL